MANKQTNSRTHLSCLVIKSLTVACIALFWCGSIFVFNVYSLALKHTFNYTQSDVNMIAALSYFGFHAALPAGIVQDRYGPVATSAIGLCLTFIGYAMFWSTTMNVEFYTRKPGLLKLYCFLIGHGVSYTYMASLATTVCNFTNEYRVQALAILETFLGGGSLILAFLYARYFTNGHMYDEENQNWTDFILMMLIGSTIANVFCVMFLRISPQFEFDNDDVEDDSAGDKTKDKTEQNGADDSETIGLFHSNQSAAHKLFKEAWRDFKRDYMTRNFQIILWLKSIISPVGFVYLINITAILKSAKLEAYNATFTILGPVVGMVSYIALTLIMQYSKGKIRKPVVLFTTNMGFVVGQGLLISLGTNLRALHVANVLMSMAHLCSFVLIVAIVSDLFNKKTFGQMWGFILLVSTIFSFLYPAIFGAVYDANMIGDSIDCYGLACTQLTFILTGVCTLVAVLLNIALIKYT